MLESTLLPLLPAPVQRVLVVTNLLSPVNLALTLLLVSLLVSFIPASAFPPQPWEVPSSPSAGDYNWRPAAHAPTTRWERITPKQLSHFSGEQDDGKGKVLMAVRRKVYDVTSGRSFYGPGGPYSNFAGRDASRGLAKQSFEADMLVQDLDGPIDPLDDLSESDWKGLQDWEEHFRNKYPVVGKRINPFDPSQYDVLRLYEDFPDLELIVDGSSSIEPYRRSATFKPFKSEWLWSVTLKGPLAGNPAVKDLLKAIGGFNTLKLHETSSLDSGALAPLFRVVLNLLHLKELYLGIDSGLEAAADLKRLLDLPRLQVLSTHCLVPEAWDNWDFSWTSGTLAWRPSITHEDMDDILERAEQRKVDLQGWLGEFELAEE
ncbi:hypothetical protein JCM8547_006248 [Rhodosporidiobolus lusitaniae]